MFTKDIYLMCMDKLDLAIYNLQKYALICLKTKPNKTKPNCLISF